MSKGHQKNLQGPPSTLDLCFASPRLVRTLGGDVWSLLSRRNSCRCSRQRTHLDQLDQNWPSLKELFSQKQANLAMMSDLTWRWDGGDHLFDHV